jgi:AcrR family transcriptional regulator
MCLIKTCAGLDVKRTDRFQADEGGFNVAQAGRRPGHSDTAEQILGAGRKLFAERGYRGATVRAIAAEAGVNQALVHHFFGSKQGLFIAAMNLPISPAEVIEQINGAGSREQAAELVIRLFFRTWFAPATHQQLLGVLRAASATSEGAAMLRHFAEDVMLPQVAAALDVPRVRLAAAIAHLLGVVFLATIVKVEPLASLGEDELVALLSPAINGYFTAGE